MRTQARCTLLLLACTAGAQAFAPAVQPIFKRPRARGGAAVLGRTRMMGGGGMTDLGDLSILGAVKKLRAGDLTKTRSIHFPGCINESYKFECEKANFFVKINRKFSCSEMFEGESAALQAMLFAGMKCPVPLRMGDLPHGGSYLIMQHIAFKPFLMLEPTSQSLLGENLAMMHLHQPDRHHFFGFGLPTRLGITPMDNTWTDSWSEFFIESRLKPVLELLASKKLPSDVVPRRVEELCERARGVLDLLPYDLRPSILHGDLWLGNAGATEEGRVAIFDPSSFYGHSEFDLAFRGWQAVEGFPGLSEEFFTAYHYHLPRADGYEERSEVYQLFHLANHACMYGSEYVPFVDEMAKKIMGK
eukprot:CAMPEP_0206266122 /NCGR_PEP_ID=MMETSP0047_2-20121206/30393_1 /ASSEMBLY_ACC=CAM_ASM_000192 /TAXON_ID=195065 /ORGANISM="Chroomonas mesostigmatica_cf, Strain CCMP1168" /LENGTH=359 /DNA_ID=CAMNT_0053694129 /DNA_START=183 /DNA_END=1262 /DNA_ORIENTATION=-